MTFQQKMVHVAFYIECVVVIGFYIFGRQGVQTLLQLRKEVDKQKVEVVVIQQDIKKLQDEVAAWEQDPFYVEQLAREKLAMSHDGEDIYVVKNVG